MSSTLFDHLQQTQRFLRDEKQELFNPQDLIEYINRARREVAARTQCVRVLTTISGQIYQWTVTNPGNGYTSPVCVITPPDFPSGAPPLPNGAQAQATANVAGGKIQSINNIYGGAGYFQPVMTITDPAGVGAIAVPTVKFVNTLNRGQEVYNFADVDLSEFAGVDSVYAVRGVTIIYQNYRYSVPIYPFTIYQAFVRQYPFQYQYVPTFGSQFGQGALGSFFMYPLPSQTYQLEWDCQCLPQDLLDNQSVEIIQPPWDDVVPYFAAHLAYLGIQNMNAGNFYLDLFDKMCLRKSQYARVGRMINPYGRF
jgi:hypothetical protein